MRRLLFAALVSSTLLATAHADPDVTVTTRQKVRIGFAVNPPLRWFSDGKEGDRAFAASLYGALGTHHVLRGNAARYPYGEDNPIGAITSESSFDGDVTDFGASYMYFPRRAFDGFVVEAGVLFRRTDGVDHGPFWDDTTRKTDYFAGRALVGWSWLFADRIFTSLQVGASAGYERGMQSVCDSSAATCMEYGGPVETKVKERTILPEGFMRIGVVFDL